MRTATTERNTAETRIKAALTLDGAGKGEIASGVGFLDHMLTLFAAHGRFDLTLTCAGDTQVDDHHSVEDIGIVLGTLMREALGDKKGVCRYGSMLLPMDEALVLTAVDFSGRAHLSYDVQIPAEKVGTFDTELCEEFWLGFVRAAGCTLHIRQLAGKKSHHIIEAVFKSAARSMRAAVKLDPDAAGEIPSTKGLL